MVKPVKCPNCGAADYEKKDEIHYTCNFCQSDFIIGEKKRQTNISGYMHNFSGGQKSVNPVPAAKIRALIFSISILILGLGIGIFVFVNSAIDNATQSAPGKLPEDDYWGTSSVSKFYFFEGSKGPVIWMLLNQSSKGLDSAKYTLQMIDPVKKRILNEFTFARMTWQEGFNFGNYLTDMLSYRDEVYFLSDANGLTVYDLYSGKIKYSNEAFYLERYTELKSGIVSAKNKYYKNAIELMTKDGFKFNYLPVFDLLVSEEEFNDYQKSRGLIGGFVLTDAPRQQLYYVISEQDTLRNDFSFSEHYLTQYMRNGKSGQYKERAFAVDEGKVFFNTVFLLRDKSRVIFAYTETLDKKSPAFLVSYTRDDFNKPDWNISFKNIKGFEKAMADNFYLRTHASEKEIAIWYETAVKSGFGVSLSSGKVNWQYELK